MCSIYNCQAIPMAYLKLHADCVSARCACGHSALMVRLGGEWRVASLHPPWRCPYSKSHTFPSSDHPLRRSAGDAVVSPDNEHLRPTAQGSSNMPIYLS